MGKKGKHSGPRGVAEDIATEASDLVAAARAHASTLGKGAVKELVRLEKGLATARATESKRLRQLAKAQATKGRRTIDKRQRQAAEAATDVAEFVGRLAAVAGSAVVRAAESVSPVKAPPSVEPTSASAPAATTRKPAGTTRKPAATTAAKPATTATTRKPATTATTRKRAAPPAKPSATTRKPAATTRRPSTSRRSLPPADPPAGDGTT
jgi:hypothetical protein